MDKKRIQALLKLLNNEQPPADQLHIIHMIYVQAHGKTYKYISDRYPIQRININIFYIEVNSTILDNRISPRQTIMDACLRAMDDISKYSETDFDSQF